MPSSPLPGNKGSDYYFVNYGGKIYVVYTVKLPNGKVVRVSWRIQPSDYKALHIQPKDVRHITQSQFKALQYFGDSTEIQNIGDKTHPLTSYFNNLRSVFGPKVSWLNDKQYMGVMLMGFMEGWSSAEIATRLQRTRWYQNRNAAQRSWELELNKADRAAALKSMTTRVTEALQDLYGTISFQEAGITGSQIQKWATSIASGEFGDPSEGFLIWVEDQRNKAEKLEGSAAWQEKQSEEESQRAFMNRPEDMFQSIKDESRQWLGPAGMPSDATLQDWADRLVSERASDADWRQFLSAQAQRLYPWLGADTPWQEFADPYRREAERLWGRSVQWEDPILRQLGATDANGVPNGASLTYYDFEQKLRSNPQFWRGPVANEEGFNLFNLLNETFMGVPS